MLVRGGPTGWRASEREYSGNGWLASDGRVETHSDAL